MSTSKSEELKKQQYERRKLICEWLDANPGWHTAPNIGRGIGIMTENIRNPVDWLERKEIIAVTYQTIPRKIARYQLAMPLAEALMQLADEWEERENHAGSDQWLDQEHLDWMTKYRKKFVERRHKMNLAIPNFATEC